MENKITAKEIESKIVTIRNQQVMIDRDLAELYETETKVLNQAVKRNIERFPEDFMFQLTDEEFENWRSQFVTSRADKMGLRRPPYAFTEQGIFYQGQIFDAYAKFESFIAQAKKEIVLIDGYVDLSVLERLAKKKASVSVTIYTDPKTKLSPQDIQKFNSQYPTLTVKHTTKMHDRFLIIDNKTLYHIGASLKDLGKKCFAFDVFDSAFVADILAKI